MTTEITITPSSSNSTSDLCRTSLKYKLIRFLLFGLSLYLLDTGLDISIASRYLDMKRCHRSFEQTFIDFKLSDMISLETSKNSSNLTDVTTSPEEKVPGFLNHFFFIELRNDLIRLLPSHWAQRLVNILSFQLSKYHPGQLTELCTFNDQRYASVIDIGLSLCSNALKEKEVKVIKDFWQDFIVDEDGMITATIKIITLVTTKNDDVKYDFVNTSQQFLDSVNLDLQTSNGIKVIARILESFSDDELKDILSIITDPIIVNNLHAIIEGVSSIEKEDIEKVKAAFKLVKPEDIPKIQEMLTQLNVTLTDFITNPGVLVSFFRDPVKSAILVEMQELLPTFTPSDINSILKIKQAIEKIPGSQDLISKVLDKFPLNSLIKIFETLDLSEDDINSVTNIVDFFKSDQIKVVRDFASERNLTSANGRTQFLDQCSHESFTIRCEDVTENICPSGHLSYGLITLGALMIPGFLYGISEFSHHKYFRFGQLLQVGMSWNILFKLIVLPFYLIIMIPMIFMITIWNYVQLIQNVIYELLDKKVDKDIEEVVENVVNLQSLEGYGEAFIQIIIQLYFIMLLILMGGGTLIAGVNAMDFFQSILPQTVISLLISVVSLSTSVWELQEYDRKSKELFFVGNYKKKKISYIFCSFAWFLSSTFIKIGSIVCLCLFLWLEMLSGSLLESGIVINCYIIPFVILLLPIPLNIFLHKKYIQEKNTFSLAHGVISAVFPASYLHRNDKGKTAKFLLWNQFIGWASLIMAWLSYGFSLYGMEDREDFGLLRIFPLFLSLSTIGPFIGAIHWGLHVQSLYYKDDKVRDEQKAPPNTKKSFSDVAGKAPLMPLKNLYIAWQVLSAITRISSFIMIIYVYYDHFQEVEHFNFKIGLAEFLPFVLLTIISNIGIQFLFFSRSFINGSIAIFVPNDFRKSDAGVTSKYLMTNILWNFTLHLIMWIIMCTYCWECTQLLSLTKLMQSFPAISVLWLVYGASTLLVWKLAIEPSFNRTLKTWPSKIYSITTSL